MYKAATLHALVAAITSLSMCPTQAQAAPTPYRLCDNPARLCENPLNQFIVWLEQNPKAFTRDAPPAQAKAEMDKATAWNGNESYEVWALRYWTLRYGVNAPFATLVKAADNLNPVDREKLRWLPFHAKGRDWSMIDLASATIDSRFPSIWVGSVDLNIVYERTRIELDCMEQRFRVKESIRNQNWEWVRNEVTMYADWSRIIPGGELATLRDTVCRK